MEKRVATLYVDFNWDEKAARAAQKAFLEEIYLVDAQTWREPLVSSPEALALEHKFSRQIFFPKDHEERLDLTFVLCKFRVAAFNEKSPKKPVMKIEATFYTSFSEPSNDPDVPTYWDLDSPEDFKEEESDALNTYWAYLYNIYPISAAWPYWREFVQSMSSRMGFPALTVPMLEIVPKKSGGKDTKSQPIKRKTIRQKKVSA